MKIGIYDPYLDDLGGGEKYMMTIAECLSKKHDVIVFWDNKKDIVDVARRFSLDLTKVKLERNIFSTQIGFFERIMKTRYYDAIILLSDWSLPFVLSKKLFLHVQQPLLRSLLHRHTFNESFKLARINAFFCNSVYTHSYVNNFFGKSRVIYPPVEIRKKQVRKENIILTVGRFRVRDPLTKNSDFKKQSVMVDTLKKMVKKGLKNWRFVLAVSVRSEEWESFEKLKKETVNYPIQFMVNKTNEELWEIYSQAKIYWHAAGYGEDLNEHPEYAEHFGISTVEAMGAGVVPVVINAGGQREVVKDGITGFLWNTLDELQEKTIILIKDKKQLEKMSKEAQKTAEIFTKKRFCREIYELLET